GLVELTARFQVGDQGGKGLVERRDQVLAQSLEVLAGTVPGVAPGSLGAEPVHLDEPSARVKEPASPEGRLTHEIATVARAEVGAGRAEVAGASHLLRADHVERLLLALRQC